MKRFSSLVFCLFAAAIVTGCTGTGAGRGLFKTPSDNNIASITVAPAVTVSRSAGTQIVPLQVSAYDKWGNLITDVYNENITIGANNSCEAQFSFYSSTVASNWNASLSWNSPEPLALQFTPSCGPNPLTVTVSAPGVPSASINL